jgi:hypothetical protein
MTLLHEIIIIIIIIIITDIIILPSFDNFLCLLYLNSICN